MAGPPEHFVVFGRKIPRTPTPLARRIIFRHHAIIIRHASTGGEMPSPEIMVPARYYAKLVDVLVHDGIDLLKLLNSLRLSPSLLAEPDAKLKASQADRLVEQVYLQSGRTDVAFDIGRALTVSSHSFVGFGMLNSNTVDDALRFEAQYFRLVMPSFCMRYNSGQDFGEVTLLPMISMSHLSLIQHLEAMAIAAIREIEELTGGSPPRCRLELSIPKPPHQKRYRRELPNVDVYFGAADPPCIRLKLLGNPRRLKVACADGNAKKEAEKRCQLLVERAVSEKQLADWVSMILREASGTLPTLEDIAELINISSRTLERKLAHEGTNFRNIRGAVFYQLACERLSKGMSVLEVSLSLGFNHPTNFSRAFRAHSGYNPSEH